MKYIPIVSSGKSSSEEYKDCAVRALANASDMPYDEAHECLAYHGRPDRRGTSHDSLVNAYIDAGFTNITTFGTTRMANYFNRRFADKISKKEKGITLKNFCEKYNKGKYIAVYSGHALAVVDGQVIDTFQSLANKRITIAFSKGNLTKM